MDNLGGAIKFQTISWNETSQNFEEFSKLHEYLKERFINVFSSPYVQVRTMLGITDNNLNFARLRP